MEREKEKKVVDEIAKAQESQGEPQDILSKFFRSLPSHSTPCNTTSDDQDLSEEPMLYYEQMNDELIKEAQEKLQLEGKLTELTLSKIDEQNENDADIVAIERQPLTGGVHLTRATLERQVEDIEMDRQSIAYSTASTFSPAEVKSKLCREKKKRDLTEKSRIRPKNIKGDANALRRRKQNDQSLANEDLHGYLEGGAGLW